MKPAALPEDPEDFARLIRILSACRPHGSDAEHQLLMGLLAPYAVEFFGPMQNACVTVGTGSRTLFSCHTDTVHRTGGAQRVSLDRELGKLFVKQGDCLGADDGAGMWLMLGMIDAGVPGTYLFHRGEECGCVGSAWLAAHQQAWLRGFDRAVAFDRRGTTSVITHQMGGRCCSEGFAAALAEALGMGHTPDPDGIYTDTAQYMHLIPEVTNISCGYEAEHSPQEALDVPYLVRLREALIGVNWEQLPVVRGPSPLPEAVGCLDALAPMDFDALYAFVIDNPEVVTELLFDHLEMRQRLLGGFDSEDFNHAQLYS